MESNAEHVANVIWRLIKRITFWAVVLVAVPYFVIRVESIIISILVAVFLTYVLLPGVDWLCSKRVRELRPKTQRLIATSVVFVGFLAFLGITISLIITPFRKEFNDFLANFKDYMDQFGALIDNAWAWYSSTVPADIQNVIGKLDFSGSADKVTAYLQHAVTFTTSSLSFAVEAILIPVLAFYFILDYKSLSREFYALIPHKKRHDALRIGRRMGAIMQSYTFGQLILCLIAGVLTGLVLAILGMPYVVVLALFSGITRAIPIVGPVLSGIPIVLVGVLNSSGLALPFYLLIFVIVMHFAESKFIMPRLIGHRMHLHPVVVIVALLIGAEFFGVIGMFVAAPVAALIRELVRFYYIKPNKKPVIKEPDNTELLDQVAIQ